MNGLWQKQMCFDFRSEGRDERPLVRSSTGGRASRASLPLPKRFKTGEDAVASFSPLVRKDAHQTVRHFSRGRASVATPEMTECFA